MSWMKWSRMVVTVPTLAVVANAAAQDGFLILPGINGGASRVEALSSDGRVAVGQSSGRPVAWIEGTLSELPVPPGSIQGGHAFDVNADGSVIVGIASVLDPVSMQTTPQGVVWSQGQIVALLSPLGGDAPSSIAWAVTDAGDRAVGQTTNSDPNQTAEAFVSASPFTSLTPLGIPPFGANGNFSIARGISPDGSVVVGGTAPVGTAGEAWAYASGAFIQLTSPLGNEGLAYDASDGGAVIVGQVEGLAYASISGNGLNLPNFASAILPIGAAFCASNDGSRIGGFGFEGFSQRAAVWDCDFAEPMLVSDLVKQGCESGIPATFVLTDVRGISGDGRVLAGNGRDSIGTDRAWVATVGGAPPYDPGFDLQIDRVEIAQIIQDPENSVPIIRDRWALARVFVSYTGTPPSGTNGWVAAMRAYEAGSDTPVEIPVLRSATPGCAPRSDNGPLITPQPVSQTTTTYNDTLNFVFQLPSDMSIDRLVFTVNDAGTEPEGISLVAESSCANNSASIDISELPPMSFVDDGDWRTAFAVTRRPARLLMWRLNSGRQGIPFPVFTDTSNARIEAAVEWTRSNSPFEDIDASCVNCTSTVQRVNELNYSFSNIDLLRKYTRRLYARWQSTSPSGSLSVDGIVLWITDPLSARLGINGNTSIEQPFLTIAADSEGRAGRTLAHELWHGYCANGYHDCGRTGHVGVNPIAGQDYMLMPSNKRQIMQTQGFAPACGSAPLLTADSWMTVEEIREAIIATGPQYGRVAGRGAGPVTAIFGDVDFAGASGGIDFVDNLPLAMPTQEDPEGNIVVVLSGVGNQQLFDGRYSVSPPLDTDGSFPTSFLIQAPVEAQLVQRAEIRWADTNSLLASKSRSGLAPTVSFNAPAPGASVLDESIVEWTISDGDSSLLFSTLRYSWNGGTDWAVLLLDDPGTSWIVDLEGLPSSADGQGIFEVAVTDGFNESFAQVAGLTVDDPKHPEVLLLAPESGRRFGIGEPVSFRCVAVDAEDGELSGSDVVWTSSADGFLASGDEATVTFTSAGTRLIAATATDSSSLTSSSIVSIEIVDRDFRCLADANGDGRVTPADYNAWILAYNTQDPACDQNGDGACTPADYNAWILNFNAGCP